jgi:SsrA-binding protein
MSSPPEHDPERYKMAAQNRKARHDYAIEQTFEAGIELFGTEVKSLRAGRAQITESYATERGRELFLFNAHIPEYGQAAKGQSHEPRRPRKLLLHKNEINKLMGAITKDGMTLVPLDIHFNQRGRAKVSLGLAKGKKKADKREAIKNREWEREKARFMKNKGRD